MTTMFDKSILNQLSFIKKLWNYTLTHIEMEKEREIWSAGSLPKTHNSWSWAMLMLEANNYILVAHVLVRDPSTLAITAVSRGTQYHQARSEAEMRLDPRYSNMECRPPNW